VKMKTDAAFSETASRQKRRGGTQEYENGTARGALCCYFLRRS
jgi:hypothetical protein